MQRKKRTSAIIIGAIWAALALTVLVAAGCGQSGGSAQNNSEANSSGSSEESEVQVELSEWAVKAEPLTIQAGEVEFIAKNMGTETHELVVARDGKVVDEIEDIVAGSTHELELELEPGEYELFCEIVETEENGEKEDHKALGMHTEFVVQ